MTRKLSTLLRDAWVIAGITLLCLLLLDALLKSVVPESARFARVDPDVSAPEAANTDAMSGYDWADEYFRELRDARRTRWQPYVYWKREPFDGRYINIDQDGFRQSWQPPGHETAQLAELWVLGGSTVWGTGARDAHTIPSYLGQLLADQGRPVRIVNLGESGYVSGQELAQLVDRLRQGRRPEVVVFYHGVNDVFAALQHDRAGIPQNESHRARDFRVTDGLDNWLEAFPRVLEGVQRLAAVLGQPPEMANVDTLADAIATQYQVNVRAAAGLAETFGFQSRFFWQPTVFSKNKLGGDEQQILLSSLQRHRDLQLAVDRRVKQVMDGQPQWTSLTDVLDHRPLFMDFCHLSEAGNRQIAEAMLPQLLPSQSTRD
ncbi:MAG: SGNH/GDSL hydrolase family protein [Xanthomonadales bacterium]|nr:SGNH/GDSL hydrolase family protein [Xanthomonadales bacterium]